MQLLFVESVFLKSINECDLVVVGAGMAGLAAAAQASAMGKRVCVLEKSGGPGGRMATRAKEDGCWDHGAQYLPRVHLNFARRFNSGWRQVWSHLGVNLSLCGTASS